MTHDRIIMNSKVMYVGRKTFKVLFKDPSAFAIRALRKNVDHLMQDNQVYPEFKRKFITTPV
jgi:hypothetical protein